MFAAFKPHFNSSNPDMYEFLQATQHSFKWQLINLVKNLLASTKGNN